MRTIRILSTVYYDLSTSDVDTLFEMSELFISNKPFSFNLVNSPSVFVET